MFDLIYYNERGEVKSIELLFNETNNSWVCVPQENYFIKGFVIKGNYLTPYQIQKFLKDDLTALENHFFTCRYGFFPELNKFSFRNENQEYILKATDELIKLYKSV